MDNYYYVIRLSSDKSHQKVYRIHFWNHRVEFWSRGSHWIKSAHTEQTLFKHINNYGDTRYVVYQKPLGLLK